MEKSISMPVSIYALGGLGEVGKNMYCIENEETIVIIDCGVRFPGVEFPGIDYVVPASACSDELIACLGFLSIICTDKDH